MQGSLCSGRGGRCIRRLDGASPCPAGRMGHAVRCMGSGECAFELWRRDSHHKSDLRPRSRLRGNGQALARAVAKQRGPLESQTYHQIGMLWLAGNDDKYERAAVRLLGEAGLGYEELSACEAKRRFPQFHFEGVKWTILEKDAGYITARVACEAVLAAFRAEGGEYRQLAAKPGAIKRKQMRELVLSDGSKFSADAFVFAGGPWLGELFPDVIGNRIAPTRQEVFFFGPPAGESSFTEEGMPAWIDHGERRFYGIPGNRWRGFKVADDRRGGSFDPTSGERVSTKETINAARSYLGFRFPGMRDAPLLESRVCQYENSPDHHFVVDRHTTAENVWLVGGGSGHGFKHGPAVGERAAGLVLGTTPVDSFFGLARLPEVLRPARLDRRGGI